MGILAQDGSIQLLQESDGFQVFLTALAVLLPLAVLAVVVQIQHAGHGVYAQAVDVIFVHPEHGAGDQEAFNFLHAVVEDHGAPLFVFAAAGVGVLVAWGAVEHVQAVTVLRKMGRNPIQNDADACLVELVHKGHEVLWGAIAAGGGKIARDLIAPAAIERILGDGQQFNMGVAHIFYVGNQLVGQLCIVVRGAVLGILHLPAASLHLVDGHRAVDDIPLGGLFGPVVVTPGVALNIVDLAAVGGAGLGMECVRVGFVDQFIGRGGDAVLINIVFLDARNEQFPDAIGYFVHRVFAGNPAVEITYNSNCFCMGRPDTENRAGDTVLHFQMRAKVAVRLLIVALLEQVNGQIRTIGRLLALLQRNLPFWNGPKWTAPNIY